MAVLSKQQKIMRISIVILLDDALKKRNSIKKKKPNRFWVLNCLIFLTKVLEMFDREYFCSIFKNVPRYEHLLSIVGPELQCQRTHLREPISPSERLTPTLRYLASGELQQSLSFAFRNSRTAISNILAVVCMYG